MMVEVHKNRIAIQKRYSVCVWKDPWKCHKICFQWCSVGKSAAFRSYLFIYLFIYKLLWFCVCFAFCSLWLIGELSYLTTQLMGFLFTTSPPSCCLSSRAMSSAATTSPSVDKVDGFSRKSVRKAKQKRSQSSSQFRSQGKPIELTPLPLLKGKTGGSMCVGVGECDCLRGPLTHLNWIFWLGYLDIGGFWSHDGIQHKLLETSNVC